MKKAVIAAAVATMLSAPSYADTLLGVYIGGEIWDTEASGSFGDMSAQNNFNFEDEKNNSFYVALEHPIPLVPNLKYSQTDLTTQGGATIDSSFTFSGVTFGSGVAATTDFDLSFADYTLYYEIFDNDLLTVDIGLTGRDFDGSIYVASSSLESTLDVSQIVPMLYASTIVGIPATSFSVFAQGNFLSFDDHTLYDYKVGVTYELLDNVAVDLDINLGYRAMKLELEDLDDLYSNIEFKGVYAGAELHF